MIIIANSISLALDDPLSTKTQVYQQQLDYIFLAFYTLEMIIKIFGSGFILNKGSYIRDAWNFMDFTIIIFGFLSIFATASINISSLRVFRVLRPLRTITKIEGLRTIVTALITALPLLRDTIIVLLFFFIIFAIAGVQLFSGYLKYRCVDVETGIPNYDLFCGSQICPKTHFYSDGSYDPEGSKYFCGQTNRNPNYGSTSFDNLLYALLVILQSVTLEGWTPIMVTLGKTLSPMAVLYFFPIVFIGAFFLLNLTLAVINSKFNDAHKEQQKKKKILKQAGSIKQETEVKNAAASTENNSIKRYLVAKRAARKMVTFMQKKKLSPNVIAGSQLFSENQIDNFSESSFMPNNLAKEPYRDDSGEISLRMSRNAPQFDSRSFETTEQNFQNQIPTGSNPLINRILQQRQDQSLLLSNRQDEQGINSNQQMKRLKKPMIKNPSQKELIQQNRQPPQYSRAKILRTPHSYYKDLRTVKAIKMLLGKLSIKVRWQSSNLYQLADQESLKLIVNIITSRLETYIKKVELKRRSKMVGFDHKTQKIVINQAAKYQSASELDVLEKRNQSNDLKMQLQEKNNKKQTNTSSQPYQMRVQYELHRESDEDEEYIQSAIKKKEFEQLEPYQFVNSIHHQQNLKNVPISDITKKSNLIYTGSLSLIIQKRNQQSQVQRTVKKNQDEKLKRSKTLTNQTLNHRDSGASRKIGVSISQISQPSLAKSQKIQVAGQRRGAISTNFENQPKNESTIQKSQLQQVAKESKSQLPNDNQKPFSNFQNLDRSIDSDRQDFMNPISKIKRGQWSGQDVMNGMNLQRAENILDRLNNIRVFPKGAYGKMSKLQKMIKSFVKSNFIENFMTICVTMNTITLAIDRYNIPQDQSRLLIIFNNIFTGIFGFELCTKILGLGIRSVISRSIQSFAYIALLLILFIFIYSLLGMQIFGGFYQFADGKPRSNFDSFNSAFILTFQLLTMENWNTFIYDALRSEVNEFITIIFFVSWIFIGNFILLNLFLAILLDSFLEEKEEEDELALEEELQGINQTEQDQHVQTMESQNRSKVHQKSLLQNKKRMKQLIRVNTKSEKPKQSILSLISEGLKKNLESDSAELQNEKFEEMDEKQIQIFLRRYRIVKDQDEIDLILQNIGCQKSFYIFDRKNKLRVFCYRFVTHPDVVKEVSMNLDTVFSILFAFEAIIKAIAFGFVQDEYSYLRESWNVLDFFIAVSSIIDLILIDVNLPAIKILRLLRTLRPLRLISKTSGIKTLVICLLESVGHIINVVIVLLIVWLMFAILGVSLFSGKFFYCSTNPYLNHNEMICEKDRGTWQVYDSNFDNVPNALETLFIVSTFENWITIMFQAIDSSFENQGPQEDSNMFSAYYFIFFILIGTYFFLNFFIGVLFLNFKHAQKNEAGGNFFLSLQFCLDFVEEEIHWIDMQKMILKASPDYETINVPKDWFRSKVHQIVINNIFDIFIMICIILNMLQMAFYFEGATLAYVRVLDSVNYVFTAIFTLEAIMKMIAFGRRYFVLDWNKFDFFVVIASILDITLNLLNNINSKFLRIGPQLARVLRVLRVSRLFRLIGKSKGLQALLQTITFSLPPLFNAFSLLMILFFIYAVLGVFLFSNISSGKIINDDFMNFNNFGNAMIILLRVLTGEDWNNIMFDASVDIGHLIGSIYFISFRLIGSDVMLNLFILIILQQFDQYYLPQENVIQKFKDNLEYFKTTWKKFSIKYGGLKIRESLLIKFFQSMNEPLGMPDSNEKEINKEIIKMGIRSEDGWVFFNELLYRSMKRIYGDKDFKSDIMIITEFQTLFKIHQINQALIGKKKLFSKKVNQYKDMALNRQSCNPFQQLYYFQLSFKVWREYSTKKLKLGLNQSEKEKKSADDYYEHINKYIQNFRDEDPYFNDRDSNYSYDSFYESLKEEESESEEEIPISNSRFSFINPRIIVSNAGVKKDTNLRSTLEEVQEEKSLDIQQTIQSQVQLKGLFRRESSRLLPKQSSSNLLFNDKKSAHKTSNMSLLSKNSKSKSFYEANESSSNNEIHKEQKHLKIRQELLKIQNEINNQEIKDSTPVNNKLERLMTGQEDFNNINQKRKLSQSQPRKHDI
eukprot:403358079